MMSKIMNTMLKKIKVKNGESLPEVLAAVLIIALSAVGLFTATAATRNIMEASNAKMQEVYTEVENLDAMLAAEEITDNPDYEELSCNVTYSSADASGTSECTCYTVKKETGYSPDRLYVFYGKKD